jgi:superfamily I DNA/RNA helicase
VINCDFRPRLEAKTAEGAKWGETTLLRASDELELLGKLKGRILRLLERYLAAPKEIAVLCRTNKECAQVASVLSAFVPVKAKEAARAERVPVRLWAALGFYRQPQSDWMACRYLRSAGADDAGELRAAAKAMTSVGHRIYPALFAIERTKSEWVKWMDLLLVPKAEQAWFIERMPEGWQSLSWDEIVMRLFEVPLAQEVGEGVTVTTIHSAKGREWRHVLLAFCDQQSYRPKNGAEEMRVFFVGASRAIETLTFLFSERRLDEFRGGTVAVAMHEALERLVQAGKEEKAKSGSDEQANIEPTNEG